MADPTPHLTSLLQAAIVSAFGADLAGTDPMLRPSDRADYQANVAMSLGKRLGRPPREVAEAVVGALVGSASADSAASGVAAAGVVAAAEVAGPGFINITLAESYLAEQLADSAGDPEGRFGVPVAVAPETVVVDYSHPNVAKEMHVGHLRSTIIGDAIVRMLGFLGHRIIRQNHIGDWGTPFGMLIEHLLDLGEEEAAHELSVGDLNGFYRQARVKFDSDPSFAERARERVVKLQSGEPDTLRLWRVLVSESTRYFDTVYSRLGVTLTDDDLAGESMYNPMLADVCAVLEGRGLARVDDGALCVFPSGFAGREGEPQPLIIRNRVGGYTYATTDLAAVRHRTQGLGASLLVYVVGAPQAQHLAMVFQAAREAGWLVAPARAWHVAFGSVLGADKKMYRTRVGDSIKLVDLLDEAVERALAVVASKSPGLSPDEQAAVARAVGIGAVKYADLSNDRVKDYVFDWDRMLAFDGNTAPYLQYAHARIRSIERKAAAEGMAGASAGSVILGEPAERALALQLLGFAGAVAGAVDSFQPHRLCTYLFELGSTFTSFYEQCPVLVAASPELRASRLALCGMTAQVLGLGLGLLGIEAPDRM